MGTVQLLPNVLYETRFSVPWDKVSSCMLSHTTCSTMLCFIKKMVQWHICATITTVTSFVTSANIMRLSCRERKLYRTTGGMFYSAFWEVQAHLNIVTRSMMMWNSKYPGLQNQQLDRAENERHDLVPGAWRQGHNLEDTQTPTGHGHNTASKDGKKQRNLLKHWVNSPAGAVPWQHRMI